MSTHFLRLMLAMVFLITNMNTSFGQSKTQTVTFKKGQVLDILLLSQRPDTKADLKRYFQTAFPVAKQMSYQSVPGFKVVDHTQGNFQPGSLILGKWDSLEKRENFLDRILEEVPDFHEQRRKIWLYFGLRYFEIAEDLSFTIHRNMYHVATAYWLASGNTSTFYEAWKRNVKVMNGEVLVELQEGKSPFGYQYDPNFFVITSWKSEAEFDAFQKNMQALEVDNIQHINEFVLE